MKRALLPLAAIALLASAASAQLIAFDDFNYSTGSLGAANGGTGWQSSWGATFTFASNTVSNSSVASVVNGSITPANYPFSNAGNSLSLAAGTTYRKFSTSQRLADNASDTLFFSFTATPTTAAGSTFFKFTESSINGGYNIFELGTNGSGQWALGGAYGSGGGGSGTGAGGSFTSGTSYTVVGKITTSGTSNDQAWVRIYSGSDTISATDNLSLVSTLNWSVNRTDGRASNILLVNSAVASIDAIRIGDSYASVIPEPSTYAALAGVAALGLVILRRRRS